MTPEELRQRTSNKLQASFVGLSTDLVARALTDYYSADQLVSLIVQLKRNLSLPVDLETEEVPGHGLYKVREHDPNPEVAKLEADLEH
jgi:hypothetical protein